MDQQSLGELIAQKQKQKGMTQEELAGRCELDIRTIQRIEKGEVKPYFSTLKALSKILETNFIAEMNKSHFQLNDRELSQYREILRRRG